MAALGDAYFFRDLAPRELEKVAAIVEQRTFSPGEVIVTGNQPLTNLYVVLDGRVRVAVPVERAQRSEEGTPEEVLVTIGPGEAFGEFSYADHKPASASIVADEKTVVAEIPHQALDALLDTDAPLARKVLRSMLATVVGRLRSTDAELLLARYILRYV